MQVRVEPSLVSGSVSIPCSKSMAHRAIICASLAKGISHISNITYSKDIDATISCMESLGAKITKEETSCTVEGCDLFCQTGNRILECNESGSTLRFLIPMASCTKGSITFHGKGRLLSRPMEVYEKIFNEQHLTYIQNEEGIQIKGPLKPQEYVVKGDISSQFISGLLFILPLLDQTSTIRILPPYESKSYVDLTVSMLEKFGVKIIQKEENVYEIPARQSYIARNVVVEGDFSQMAFFSVLSMLNHEVTCKNMDMNSLQGDKAIIDIQKKAGAIIQENNGLVVSTCKPEGQIIDLSNCPDLGPILCVLASYSKGETKIINAGRLRMKESDRIEAMETELKKWNVAISSTQDSITIIGKDSYSMDRTVEIYGHNDHRVVMAMTIFGLCAKSPSIIDDAQAITKSYPTFFEDIQNIKGKVNIYD